MLMFCIYCLIPLFHQYSKLLYEMIQCYDFGCMTQMVKKKSICRPPHLQPTHTNKAGRSGTKNQGTT